MNERLGDDPRWANLRADLTRTLLDSTAAAAAAHGLFVALALGSGDGPPLPASVSVHRLPGQRVDARGRALLADLARTDAEPGQDLDLGETPHGVVLRRVRARAANPDEGAPDALPSLVVDYWVEPTGSPDLVHLAFATPLPAARDAFLELFDAITRSVRVAGGPPGTPRSDR
ncbi:hypothetical protein H9657_17800 [Cellulomonas sp. Sa3CUA2]|uniref:Condensation domain-containing protein n=1 Tax=Cellulomonas avistercoris TaxID=2762242 RepID=A0ABR8QI79_9CELL|nr:hypothetical protein [Cellulomonas avistercoris]